MKLSGSSKKEYLNINTGNNVNNSKTVKNLKYSKWIYIGILLVIFSSFFKMIFMEVFQSNGIGVVIVPSYSIKIEEDAKIKKIYTEQDKEVKKGDLIFSTEYKKEEISIDSINNDKKNYEKEILVLKTKKDVNLIRLKELKEELNNVNTSYSLDLYKDDRVLDRLKAEITKIKLENMEYSKQIKVFSILSNQYQKEQKIKNIFINKDYFAKKEGKILKINYEEKDFVEKGKEVVILNLDERPFINAYFDIRDLKNFETNMKVKITLPYKESFQGIIKRIESAKLGQEEQLQSSYAPTESSIKLVIYAKDPKYDLYLDRYNNMTIELGISKW